MDSEEVLLNQGNNLFNPNNSKEQKEERPEMIHLFEKPLSIQKTKLERIIPGVLNPKGQMEYVVNAAVTSKKDQRLPMAYMAYKKNIRKKRVS